MKQASGLHLAAEYSKKLQSFLCKIKSHENHPEGLFKLGSGPSVTASTLDSTVSNLSRWFRSRDISTSKIESALKSLGSNILVTRDLCQILSSKLFPSTMAPEPTDAVKRVWFGQYAKAYLEIISGLVNKHNGEFILHAQSNPIATIKATNRLGETQFAWAKYQLRRNPNTRSFLLQCILQIKSFSPEIVEKAMDQYSNAHDLYHRAIKRHKSLPRRKFVEYSRLMLETKKVEHAKEIASNSLTLNNVRPVIALMLQDAGKPPKVTKDNIKSFLHDHCRTETDSTTLIDLFQDLEPHVEAFMQRILGSIKSLKNTN